MTKIIPASWQTPSEREAAESTGIQPARLDALPPAGYYPPGMSDPPPDSPAARLRAARLKAGLAQLDAAAAMRSPVTIQYWSDVERGRRVPSLEWLWEAAQAIGCDPHALDERLQTNRGKRKPKG